MKKIISILVALAVIASCTTSNQVVSNKLFQKRKYQKGWHINNSKKLDKSTGVDKKEETVAQNQEIEVDQENVSIVSENQKTVVNSIPKILESNIEKLVIVSNNEITISNDSRNITNQVIEEINNDNNSFEDIVITEMQETQVISTAEKNITSNSSSSGAEWWMYVLCLFIPWLAVGLVTDWDVKTVVINLLWTLLCGVPGIIHAFIIVNREG
jgi:uncharacterized membrane protein YqaE (UPF0057 family)